ncbi:MAG TPA: GAF domain-containing protein [Bryobacteraceae bacterium]|jgi:sigma-B regulation protein RsbU (phosphoserine phosphatase)
MTTPIRKAPSKGQSKSGPRFRERAELLDFLLEVADATAESIDLDKLLGNVAGIVKDVIASDLFAILLYDDKAPGLKIRYSIGHREEVVKGMTIRLGEGITGVAGETRSPVLVADVRTDPRYLNALDAVRSELAVPMVARGKLVGVIDLQSTRESAYTEQDRALLRLIGTRVASSIDNARLYLRVERQNRMFRTLGTLSREFSSILELDELLGKIAKTVRALIDYDAFSIMLVDEERQVLRHRFSERYDERVDLDNVPLGKGLTGAAALSREVVRVSDTLKDPRYIASHPDIRSEVAVPLIVQDRLVGVMDLESERVGFFTADHVRTLGLLAPQIASSVENARLYEEIAKRERSLDEDLRAARKLQGILLPRRAPLIHGLNVYVKSRAAREITGDIYDFFEFDDRAALIVFGDVSGKGAAAALYGALIIGLLRSLAPRRRSPALLMKVLNEALMERKVDAHYVALLLMLWDPDNNRFVMANAGATPPMICRGDKIIRPQVEGVPVGLLDDQNYEETVFETEPGDMLILYSDGIQDQQGTHEIEYGRNQLAIALAHYHTQSVRKVAEGIFTDLDRYMGHQAVFDDQTLIAIQVTES